MPTFSRLEQAMALLIGLDIARPGTNRAAAKAAIGALARGGRVFVPAVAASTGRLAAANPAVTGALLGGAALQTPQGQTLLDIAEEAGADTRFAVDRKIQDTLYGTAEKVKRGTKKRKTDFNKAVSSAYQALKSGKAFGKPGVINNQTKAFSVATVAASRRRKKLKPPKSGPGKVAYMGAKKVYTDEILRRKMKQ